MKPLYFLIAPLLLMFFACAESDQTKNDYINVQDLEMKDVTSDWEISWTDSSKVKMSIDRSASYNSRSFKYDSALLIKYAGYTDRDTVEKSYFPINEKGQWISTLLITKTFFMIDLKTVDSLLGSKDSFEDSLLEPFHEPQNAIIYFQKGKVIGITTLDLNQDNVKSTIKLGNGTRFYRIRREKAGKIGYLFHKYLTPQ